MQYLTSQQTMLSQKVNINNEEIRRTSQIVNRTLTSFQESLGMKFYIRIINNGLVI